MREGPSHARTYIRRWVGLLTSLFLPRFIKAAYTTTAAAAVAIIEDNDVIIHRNDGGGGSSPLLAHPTRLRKSLSTAPLFFCADSGKFTFS